jgi:hypothetical protein
MSTSHYKTFFIAATVLLGCVLAINIASFASNRAVDKTTDQEVTVNRVNKGDKLPLASVKVPTRVTAKDAAFPKQLRFGCDPAFSDIADPTRAHIYKRCAV